MRLIIALPTSMDRIRPSSKPAITHTSFWTELLSWWFARGGWTLRRMAQTLLSWLLDSSLILLLLLLRILTLVVFAFPLATFVSDGVLIGEDGGAPDFLHSLVLAVYSTPAVRLLHHVQRVDMVETGLAHLDIVDSVHHAFVLFPDCFSLPYNSTYYCEWTMFTKMWRHERPLKEYWGIISIESNLRLLDIFFLLFWVMWLYLSGRFYELITGLTLQRRSTRISLRRLISLSVRESLWTQVRKFMFKYKLQSIIIIQFLRLNDFIWGK